MSNVAAANIFLPSLACIGPKFNYSPLILLAPVALMLSLALLFPIGTPPNAIILANGNVTVKEMFRVGMICTILFMTTIISWTTFVMPNIIDVVHYSPAIDYLCSNE